MRYSGGYVSINPNFIISKIENKSPIDQNLSDVIDIVKNILFRGVPTKPSLFLQEKLGVPTVGKMKYTYGTKKNEWGMVIKTGEKRAPALALYEKLCEAHPDIASIILPECSFGDILLDNMNSKESADFYIPSHKVEIEVDGRQHTDSKEADTIRDNRLKEAGVELIERITSDELYARLDEKINETIDLVDERNNEDLIAPNVDNVSKAYMYVFRFQVLILELLQKGVLSLDKEYFELSFANLDEDSIVKNSFVLAYEDIKLWIKNLFVLLDKEIIFPEIRFVDESDCNVDVDIYNRYDQNSLNSKESIFIRNDYFLYDFNSLGSSKSYCQSKNYNFIRKNDLRFESVDKTNEAHCSALTFFLQNLFLGENAKFRPHQIDIISRGLKSEEAVVGLLPTGSGKSVCFQLIGMLTAGTTLVVSPLKLLMKDQCENLSNRNLINNAIYINSDNHEYQSAFKHNQAKFIYISPERFFTSGFKNMFVNISKNIAHIVIDEVHCLSEWGHDFRTSYLLILSFIRENLNCERLLLTGTSATASPHVIDDIKIEFNNIKKRVHVERSSTVRRNELTFRLVPVYRSSKMEAVRAYTTQKAKEKTLIFVPTRKLANEVVGYLSKYNIESGKYTGQSSNEYDVEEKESSTAKTKEQHFEEFRDGKSLVMTATKAFGMGVDIPDVRQTIHYEMSSSVESLYQEVGRAGRDGKKSDCVILLNQSNEKTKMEIEELFNASIEDFLDVISDDKKRNQYGDLATQLYFISTSASMPDEFADFVYKTIEFLNEINGEEFTLERAFNALCEKNGVIKEKFYNKYFGEADYEKFLRFFEKALYRLYILGVIELWSIRYKHNQKDRTYTNIFLNEIEPIECSKNLEKYINKYESYIFSHEETEKITFNQVLLEFCKWDNDHFLRYRKDSLYTLYEFIQTFKNSDDFAKRIENYFVDNPEIKRIIFENEFNLSKIFECLEKNDPRALQDQLQRYIEGNRYKTSLYFMFGIVSVKNGKFNSDVEEKLKKSFYNMFLKEETLDKEEFVLKSIKFLNNDRKQLMKYLRVIFEKYSFVLYSCKSEEIKKLVSDIKEWIELENVFSSLEKIKKMLGEINE